MSFYIQCAQCGAVAELTQEGRFCSPRCRAAGWRVALQGQRDRLGTEADAALRSGDVAALEAVARRAAALLHP